MSSARSGSSAGTPAVPATSSSGSGSVRRARSQRVDIPLRQYRREATSPGCFGRGNNERAIGGRRFLHPCHRDRHTGSRQAHERCRTDPAHRRNGTAPADAPGRSGPTLHLVPGRTRLPAQDPQGGRRRSTGPPRASTAYRWGMHAVRWRSAPPRTRRV